jgi:hypothetical protein
LHVVGLVVSAISKQEREGTGLVTVEVRPHSDRPPSEIAGLAKPLAHLVSHQLAAASKKFPTFDSVLVNIKFLIRIPKWPPRPLPELSELLQSRKSQPKPSPSEASLRF